MKKLGTPTLAAPGGASVYVGSAGVGGVSGAGAGVTWGTAPVSDCVLPAASFVTFPVVSVTFLTGLSAFGLPLLLPLPLPVWPWAGAVAVGDGAAVVGAAVGVGETVTPTGAVAVGVGVPSAERRSTIEATGAGRPGICTWSTGVPSGTSTVTVSCWPVISVTRT